jgi:glycosyltransferase involved in cell wall biosynthesis
MKDFKVSVIIPVYNAAQYVRKAVESAVFLDDVGEVILIEDGSPDNAREVCEQLKKEYAKVSYFRHPGEQNKGAGESRNLGIRNAKNEYIAFLDADDWFLPNRFLKDKKVFKDFNIDGVYNASSYSIDSEYAHNQIKNRYKTDDPENYLYTVREEIDQEDLFYYLLNGGRGHFHTTAITLRKRVFEKVGYFSDLKLHQDNHMFLRVASKCILKAGEINKPTSRIRVHIDNRIKNVNKESRVLYYTSLYKDVFKELKQDRDKTTLIKKLISAKTLHIKSKPNRLLAIVYFSVQHFIKNPGDMGSFKLKYFLNSKV